MDTHPFDQMFTFIVFLPHVRLRIHSGGVVTRSYHQDNCIPGASCLSRNTSAEGGRKGKKNRRTKNANDKILGMSRFPTASYGSHLVGLFFSFVEEVG